MTCCLVVRTPGASSPTLKDIFFSCNAERLSSREMSAQPQKVGPAPAAGVRKPESDAGIDIEDDEDDVGFFAKVLVHYY